MLKLIILKMKGDIPNTFSKLNLVSKAAKLPTESHWSNISYKDIEAAGDSWSWLQSWSQGSEFKPCSWAPCWFGANLKAKKKKKNALSSLFNCYKDISRVINVLRLNFEYRLSWRVQLWKLENSNNDADGLHFQSF